MGLCWSRVLPWRWWDGRWWWLHPAGTPPWGVHLGGMMGELQHHKTEGAVLASAGMCMVR